MEKEQVTQTGRWLISGPAILLGLLYLTWRGMATLDAADPIRIGIGWVLYMAEIASFAAMASLFVQAIRPMKRRTDPPIDPEFLPTVEILVSVDRESVEQAYRTIISAAALRYPSASKTITLLDRGGKRDDREALQSLAKQFQCRYLLLPSEGADGKRFDASPSFGEYLLVLQAGDIPQPDLLRKTIGFFRGLSRSREGDSTPTLFRAPFFFKKRSRRWMPCSIGSSRPGLITPGPPLRSEVERFIGARRCRPSLRPFPKQRPGRSAGAPCSMPEVGVRSIWIRARCSRALQPPSLKPISGSGGIRSATRSVSSSWASVYEG